jgi:Rrf2 family protein
MIMTREADYAIRILRSLRSGVMKSTPDICEEENLPIHFVYRILKKLDKAGIVNILRGKEGGAILIGDLSRTSILDIMTAIGKHEYVSACTKPGHECEYKRCHGDHCSVYNHMLSIQTNLDKVLMDKTILQVIEDA